MQPRPTTPRRPHTPHSTTRPSPEPATPLLDPTPMTDASQETSQHPHANHTRHQTHNLALHSDEDYAGSPRPRHLSPSHAGGHHPMTPAATPPSTNWTTTLDRHDIGDTTLTPPRPPHTPAQTQPRPYTSRNKTTHHHPPPTLGPPPAPLPRATGTTKGRTRKPATNQTL